MFDLKKLKTGATALGVAAAMMASAATAETVIRIQSVLSNSSDEVKMLGSFADDVAALTAAL